MQITLTGKHLEVTEALKSYAEQKLAKLERYFRRVDSADVVASQQRSFFVVEVTLLANGYLLRAEERDADMYRAVDRVLEKLEHQLKKHKTKLIQRRTGAAEATPAEQEQPAPPVEEQPAAAVGQLVRTKRFAIKPMSPEEAVLEMELLGHDFFVFSNSDTEQVNVVYRRKDGNYGLIEPEY